MSGSQHFYSMLWICDFMQVVCKLTSCGQPNKRQRRTAKVTRDWWCCFLQSHCDNQIRMILEWRFQSNFLLMSMNLLICSVWGGWWRPDVVCRSANMFFSKGESYSARLIHDPPQNIIHGSGSSGIGYIKTAYSGFTVCLNMEVESLIVFKQANAGLFFSLALTMYLTHSD